MFLGIDLGTTCVKILLLSAEQEVLAVKHHDLTIQRPKPLWSEQTPADWWAGVCEIIDEVARELPDQVSQVKAIGLSGQMHGAVLLNNEGQVLRPAILWNDGRCEAECKTLEETSNVHAITGNLVMPGFTAPKLLWVKNHEPEIFEQISKVLLPKDFLRYPLSGVYAMDCSDAAGTLWLDVKKREWSEEMVRATGLTLEQMPKLVEGSDNSATLSAELAKRWGMSDNVIIAGGAGDNAASAVGIGTTEPNEGFISLGTSGVVFLCNDDFYPNPEQGIHAFCHALPNRWHQMSVMLSAASGLRWATSFTHFANEAEAMSAVEELSEEQRKHAPIFLPYLCGERTPHNNPNAQGVFFGLTPSHTAADIIYSVIEGVSFGLLDGFRGLKNFDQVKSLCLVGGGAKSTYWSQLLADIFNVPMTIHSGSETAGALGAARLGHLAVGGQEADVCKLMPTLATFNPNSELQSTFEPRYQKFRALYQANKQFFV